MKELIIIRHAKSSWSHVNLTDAERPLNKRGLKAAPEMGKRLAKFDLRPDRILSSPAVRAATTARIIAEAIGFPEKDIHFDQQLYLAEVDQLLGIIHAVDKTAQRIMLFGHNPGVTHLSNYLADAGIDNVPTCGIVRIGFEIDDWSRVNQGHGKLIDFDYPKKPAL